MSDSPVNDQNTCVRILGVSDVELGLIYTPTITTRFADTDLVIGCGDLPHYYLEFIVSMLDTPLYYVHGNHVSEIESTTGGDRKEPWGGINLHERCVRDPSGLLLAGVEGSVLYNYGPRQYSQAEMWSHILLMTPSFFINKLRFGRYIDVFVSHAPPWKIHDREDVPHVGIKAFRWLDRVFKPAIHMHGHIHLYRRDSITETLFHQTRVINSYGYARVEFPCSREQIIRSRLKDWRPRKNT